MKQVLMLAAVLFGLSLIGVADLAAQGGCDQCRDEEEPILGWMHIFGGEGAHFDTPHGGEGPDTCGEWHEPCIPGEEEEAIAFVA